MNNEFKMKINNQGFRQFQEYFGRNKKRKCMFKNCDREAIKSHAISEEASLKLIAEKGDLITLKSQRNGMEWRFEFKPISTGDSSTFAGFCHDHDQLFRRLDIGKIETDFDLINQCFRSMAYTLYNYEYYFKVNRQQRDNLEEFISLQPDIYKNLGMTQKIDTFMRMIGCGKGGLKCMKELMNLKMN